MLQQLAENPADEAVKRARALAAALACDERVAAALTFSFMSLSGPPATNLKQLWRAAKKELVGKGKEGDAEEKGADEEKNKEEEGKK